MKKNYIIIGIILLIGAGFIKSATGELTTYATFQDAKESNKRVKIVGDLDRDKDIIYNPEEDSNLLKFYLTDADGVSNEVILTKPKPQDFERSEKVTISGKMNGDVFVADEMLLKCPSKYKDEEILIRSKG